MTTDRARRIAEVTARLQRVCAHWPPDAFAALVASVVDTALKYEERLTVLGAAWNAGPARAETSTTEPPRD